MSITTPEQPQASDREQGEVLFGFDAAGNVTIPEGLGHSGNLAPEAGGEIPGGPIFDKTTLREAVDKGFVIVPHNVSDLTGPEDTSPAVTPPVESPGVPPAAPKNPGTSEHPGHKRRNVLVASGAALALLVTGVGLGKALNSKNENARPKAIATAPVTPSPAAAETSAPSTPSETGSATPGSETIPVIGKPFTVEPKLVKETSLEGKALVQSLRISASRYKTPEEAFGQYSNRLRDWMNTGNATTADTVNKYQGGVYKWLDDLSAKTGAAYTAALLGPNAGDPGLASWAQDRITVHHYNLVWDVKILYPNNNVVTTQVDKPFRVGYVATLKNITKVGGVNNEFTASFDSSVIDNGGENIVGRSRANDGSGPLGDMTPDTPNNLSHNTVSLVQANVGNDTFWVVAP
jgi:hypothetical protein